MKRTLLALILSVTACGPTATDGPDDIPPPPVDDYVMSKPGLVAVAPGRIALGDTVEVIGSAFVPTEHGSVALRFTGTFIDDRGDEAHYDAELPLAYVNPAVAEAEFGPNVIFSPTGDRVGTFHGEARIVNRHGEDELASDPIDVALEVLPSLVLEHLRSVDASNCSTVTRATVAGQNLAFGVRAIGLGTASPSNPWTFRMHFQAPTLKAQFVRDEWYNSWPAQPTAVGTTADGFHTLETRVTTGASLYVDPSVQEQVYTVSPPARIAQGEQSRVKLYSIKTGPVEGYASSNTANIFVELETASGATATRSVRLDVWNEGQILPYNGRTRVVERFEAQLVSACFAGGDIGRDLTYTEGQSETRTRSMSFRWDTNTALSLGLQVGTGFTSPIQFGVNTSATWSQTFGVDVSEAVTTERHTGQNLTAHILPSYFGACYRQTEQVERSVGIIYHNACGASGNVGDAVLTDWNWGFDIATGPECAPPTNLPPGEVF